MSTRQLVRINPKITGNIKLVVSDDKMYMESLPVPGFNDKKFRNVPVNPKSSYQKDIKLFLRGKISVPNSLVYAVNKEYDDTKIYGSFQNQYENFYNCGCSINRDSYYKERYRIQSSLWLGDEIPKYFIIFKIDSGKFTFENRELKNPPTIVKGRIYKVFTGEGDTQSSILYGSNSYKDGQIFEGGEIPTYNISGQANLIDITEPDINNNFLKDFISPSQIVKTFDLSDNTDIGKYLKKLRTDVNFKQDDIFVDYRNRNILFYGIDIDNGYITTKKESLGDFIDNDSLVSEFDEFVTGGFERNSLLNMRNLNIEFLFDDNSNVDKFARYYGMYMDMEELATFFPDTAYPDYLDARRSQLFGNVIGIDEHREILGTIPILIKNYYSSQRTENMRLNVTVNKLYYSIFGSFEFESFDDSFETGEDTLIGALVKDNMVIDNNITVSNLNLGNSYTVRLYVKFDNTTSLGSPAVTSDVDTYDYFLDISLQPYLAQYTAPITSAKLCNLIKQALATLNDECNESFVLDDFTRYGISLSNANDIGGGTFEEVEVYYFGHIHKVGELTAVDVKIPVYDTVKDYKTTAGYFFLEGNGKLAKVDNIGSDQNIIEQNSVLFYSIEQERNLGLIEPFFNIVTSQNTNIKIGNFDYDVVVYGPISMKLLYDVINSGNLEEPVLIKIGEEIKITIDSTELNFVVVSNKNYQTKITLNNNDLLLEDIFNFERKEVPGKLLKEAGRSMLSISVTGEYDTTDRFVFCYKKKFLFEVIADELGGYEPGTNVMKYFYPYGTPNQVAAAMASAFDFQFEKHDLPFRAYAFLDTVIIICNNYGALYNDYNLTVFATKRDNALNRTYFIGGTDRSINRLQVDSYMDIKNCYVVSAFRHFKIISINLDIDGINSNTDKLSGKYIITFIGDKNAFLYEGVSTILVPRPVSFKAGRIINISDFDTDTYSTVYNRTHDIEYNKYYDVKTLEIGERYYVKKVSTDLSIPRIKHGNSIYGLDDEFMCRADGFEILEGSPVIINKKFYDDKELISFTGFGNIYYKNRGLETLNLIGDKRKIFYDTKYTEYDRYDENGIPAQLMKKMVPTICKFALTDSLDVRNNPYRISTSSSLGETCFTPSFSDYDSNPKYFTHEFYYLSDHPGNISLLDYIEEDSYFSSKFNKELLKRTDLDYFAQFFNYRYPILNSDYTQIGIVPSQQRYSRLKTIGTENGKFVMVTFFRGVRLKFESLTNMDNWKFSCIINLKETDVLEDQEPVIFENITNTTHKNMTFVITVNVDDYKIKKTGKGITDGIYGEYLYLYVMESIRHYDLQTQVFNNGLVVNLPNIPNIVLVDGNDRIKSSIFATKLYVKVKEFGNATVTFSQDQQLDQQYKLIDNSQSRFFMLDKFGALFATERNGYISDSKYTIERTTTIKEVIGNTLKLDSNGIFVINVPGLTTGVNTDTSIVNTIYNVNNLVWLNEQGGIGYMNYIRKRISFGFMVKLQKEKGIFNNDLVVSTFVEPDILTKKNTVKLSYDQKNLEGNPAIVVKTPVHTLDDTLPQKLYRYNGGGTIIFKDIVKFSDLNYHSSLGGIANPIDSNNRMDSYSLSTKLADKYNGVLHDYILHDIVPINIIGNNIYNGTLIQGNFIFYLLGSRMGDIINVWFHKISDSQLLTTTNPQYYGIGESAIEKGTLNIFYSNFDRRYFKFNRGTFDTATGMNGIKLDRNFMNTIMYGLEEESDFVNWEYVNMADRPSFDNTQPENNQCLIIEDNEYSYLKINSQSVIKYYYTGKLTARLVSLFEDVDTQEYIRKFLEVNIVPNINVREIKILSRPDTQTKYMNIGTLSSAIGVGYRQDKTMTSEYTDSNTIVFKIKKSGVAILPAIIFGR